MEIVSLSAGIVLLIVFIVWIGLAYAGMFDEGD